MKLPKHHFKRNRGQQLLREAAACIPDQAALVRVIDSLPEAAREDAFAKIRPHLKFPLNG